MFKPSKAEAITAISSPSESWRQEAMRPYPAFTQPALPPTRATPPGLPVASAAAHKHPIAHEALSLFLKFYLQEVQSPPPSRYLTRGAGQLSQASTRAQHFPCFSVVISVLFSATLTATTG